MPGRERYQARCRGEEHERIVFIRVCSGKQRTSVETGIQIKHFWTRIHTVWERKCLCSMKSTRACVNLVVWNHPQKMESKIYLVNCVQGEDKTKQKKKRCNVLTPGECLHSSLGSLQKINNEQGWENCEKQSPGAAWLHHLWERLCKTSSGNSTPRLPRHDGSADPLNELTEVSFGLWKQGTIRWVESSEGVVPLIRAPSTHTRVGFYLPRAAKLATLDYRNTGCFLFYPGLDGHSFRKVEEWL